MMVRNPRFEKLFEPSWIGRVKTRNRIVKTAAGMAFSDGPDITDKDKAYFEAIVKGGVGLIIMGGRIIDRHLGTNMQDQSTWNDISHIERFRELTQLMHEYDCPIFLQFFHGGAMHPPESPASQPISASTLTEEELKERMPPHIPGRLPREITLPEIHDTIKKFATAAEWTKIAGFDGMEINVGTSHLGNSFLSRAWNRRDDEYGCQDLKSRSRFAIEIIQETKRRVGKDFPVSVLYNIAEYGIDQGITVEEGKEFAKIFQAAGADAIQARVYGYNDYSRLHWPEHMYYPEPPESLTNELDWSRKGAGAYIPLVAAIKETVTIPVITAGRLGPELGERALQQGKIDFIGMTRRLFADPDLPNKVFSGDLKDIAPCTACHHCTSSVGEGHSIVCRINAALGSDKEYAIKPAEKRKKVVVVGGGPGGMEAARVAAKRGHEVILYENESKLGGLLPIAALIKGIEIEDLTALNSYLKRQIAKLGVKKILGTKFNGPLMDAEKPDVVILATGGTPIIPEIPGIENPIVLSVPDLYKKLKGYLKYLSPNILIWLTKIWMPVGKRVVILGGDIQGCELAEFLVKRGRRVTIMDTAEKMGTSIPLVNQVHLIEWLDKKGVVMMPNVKYEEITDYGIRIITREGMTRAIEADTIIPAMPLSPNRELLKSLERGGLELYSIGDCSQPGLIIDAIADAWRIGQAI